MATRNLRTILKKIYPNGDIDNIFFKTRAKDVVVDESGTQTLADIADKVNDSAEGATKTEKSSTNGNLKIDGSEVNVYTHPTSGVTAGTYNSVTVDKNGHVTKGTRVTDWTGTVSGNASNATNTFTQATSRANLTSGEKQSTSFGKIMKWFADLGTMAFASNVGTANLDSTLTTFYNAAITTDNVTKSTSITAAGWVADARAIAALQTQINTINSNITSMKTGGLIYKKVLTSSDDLDNITENGLYYFNTSSVPSNSPVSNSSVVEVLGATSTTTYKIQRVTRHAVPGISFMRGLNNGTWLPWAQTVSTNETAQSNVGWVTVYVSTSGDDNTNTGLSSSSPLKTIKGALARFTGKKVLIYLAAGTYNVGSLHIGTVPKVKILGDSSNISKYIIKGAISTRGTNLHIEGVTFSTDFSTYGYSIYAYVSNLYIKYCVFKATTSSSTVTDNCRYICSNTGIIYAEQTEFYGTTATTINAICGYAGSLVEAELCTFDTCNYGIYTNGGIWQERNTNTFTNMITADWCMNVGSTRLPVNSKAYKSSQPTIKQLRLIAAGTSTPTTSTIANGEVYFKYSS